MSKPTNLLNALSSLPEESLVEGAQITLTHIDGSSFTVTMGERVSPEPSPFAITY